MIIQIIPYLVIISVVVLSAILAMSEKQNREKIDKKYITIMAIIYFQFLFLDLGSSTPYGLQCGGQESHFMLRNLLSFMGWVAIPVQMAIQMSWFIGGLIISELIILTQRTYSLRFITRTVYFMFALFLAFSNLFAAIGNFMFCGGA